MIRRFEAVLFDFFGTLVDNLSASAHNAAIRAMGRTVGAPEEPFLQQWMSDYDARGSGRWDTVEDCIVHTCETIRVKPDIEHVPEAARIRRAFIREALVLRPDARHTLHALKDRGLKTGVVTDCPPELPSLWPELDLAELIDVPVFSSVAKVRKPDPRIYRLACERLAVKPQTSLFVGDGGSRELSGAQAVGMTALCIRSASEDGYDPHRIDADTWHGPTIHVLQEVVTIVDAGMP